LPLEDRVGFEDWLRHDFSGVRVHHDTQAGDAAASVGARAFTVGDHVVFGAGEYRPDSAAGREVIAHELVHVVQQASSPTGSPLQIGRDDSPLEHEAHERAAHGGPVRQAAPMGQLSRLPSWRSLKEAAYTQLIAGLRATRQWVLERLRAQVPRLPGWLQPIANGVIDVVGVIADIDIALVLAVVGIVVGFGEGVVGLITGLVRLLVGSVTGLYALVADLLTGTTARSAAWWGSFVDTIKAIPIGLRMLITNWLAEFEHASPERAGLMIGELTGQILAIIATFAVAAARAGTPATLAVEGEATVTTAARAAPTLTLIEGGSQPAARAGSVASTSGNAALALAPEGAAAARPALRLVSPPAPEIAAAAEPAAAAAPQASGIAAPAVAPATVAAGQASRAAQAARDERDRERATRCARRFPQAVPIKWPIALWRFAASPVQPEEDPGARSTRYDLPEQALLTKVSAAFYDPDRPEINRYRTRMQNPPFRLNWSAGLPVHHKWPMYLEGPGDKERAEGDYDADGRILDAPNLVVLAADVHRDWHRMLEEQPFGPRPGSGPKGSTPDGEQFCVMDLMDR
jgi:hypothetical protein